MSEETRLRRQQHYHEVCRQQGWMAEGGEAVWPEDREQLAEVAREQFGLAMIAGTDSTFCEVKEQLGAGELAAKPSLEKARAVLKAMADDEKAAVLTLVDDVLDSAVYNFSIQLDRFDHGHLTVKFQRVDEESCEPIPETEVEINPFGDFEMFQDALRWREEFSMGAKIGRPTGPHEVSSAGS